MMPEKIAQARELRDKGKSYRAIADALGVSPKTIRYNLIPEVREKSRLRDKQYYENHKREYRQYRQKRREEKSVYDKQYHINHCYNPDEISLSAPNN